MYTKMCFYVKEKRIGEVTGGAEKAKSSAGGTVKRIAVIAGTNVDTRMGVEYVERRCWELGLSGIEAVYCPVSETCDDQVKFQYSDDDEKRERIDAIFDPEIKAGTRDFFIYCNSLSGSFDFDTYSEEKGVNIVTPLHVYRLLGSSFDRVGVMTANNISAHGVEQAMMAANPDIYVIGSGNMAVVHAIEEGLTPSEIVENCGIEQLIRYMETCGCETVILGCTHFPYLKEEIEKLSSLPVIDPANMMFDMIDGRAE